MEILPLLVFTHSPSKQLHTSWGLSISGHKNEIKGRESKVATYSRSTIYQPSITERDFVKDICVSFGVKKSSCKESGSVLTSKVCVENQCRTKPLKREHG